MPDDPYASRPIDPRSPVRPIPTDQPGRKLRPGTALCLSGGGYRAMLFHVGAIWRLYEAGLLKTLLQVSSVSGGSITAGVLALAWNKLTVGAPEREILEREFVTPLRRLAGVTVDVWSVVTGLLLPFVSISDRVASAYDKYLFHGATLQDLPNDPRFVINATNIQSGVLWRFMKAYMADYRVGIVHNPTLALARAVAASSAFPPVLAPMRLRLDPELVQPADGTDLHEEPYISKAILADGGVYDNLGLETAWKNYDTVLVSDGGAKFQAQKKPWTDWLLLTYRAFMVIDNQVGALRKRQVIDSYKADPTDPIYRKGAYWGIATDIADYKLPDALPCPHDRTLELAATPTRLERMDDRTQERLIDWGYAVCDAALRKYVQPDLTRPTSFPYSGGV
jgi:NTE family protein